MAKQKLKHLILYRNLIIIHAWMKYNYIIITCNDLHIVNYKL
jgi:hypothetical protein